MDFHGLYQSNLHKISVGPYESPTFQLIGSDIVAHLPVLEWYASLCEHVVEMGVRDGQSTTAFIAGCKGKVESYDIQQTPIMNVLNDMTLPCLWTFTIADTANLLPFKETDMIFFDTLHTYGQLSAELRRHGRKAKKFLAFHDTFTCGQLDLSGPNPAARGIMPAIDEFMSEYVDQYKVVYSTKVCNGLLVLERVACDI